MGQTRFREGMQELFPPGFLSNVESVGAKLNTETDLKIKEAEDRSYKLRSIIDVWKTEQDADRKIKRYYATILIIILGIEIAAAMILMYLLGTKHLELSEWVANIFFVGVFGQTASLSHIIVKYLFPDIKLDFLKIISNL